MGGTFDHFHIGHRHFLEFAGSLADNIIVGITTPKLSEHKVAVELIEPFDIRKKSVEDFLTSKQIPFETFMLTDTYGPTLRNSKVDAVVVTEQTVSGGTTINAKREELGLPELPVHVCSLLRDVSGDLISSTRIRRGKINREGVVYAVPIRNGLKLSMTQSSHFVNAQGPVILSQKPAQLTMPAIIVGDVVAETFINNTWPASLLVFDQRSSRQPYSSEVLQKLVTTSPSVSTIKNPAGQITKEAVNWIEKFCDSLTGQQSSSPSVLLIEGEEDLITVAAVLLAPLGIRVYYGQPHEGIVELNITEEVKEHFYIPFSS